MSSYDGTAAGYGTVSLTAQGDVAFGHHHH